MSVYHQYHLYSICIYRVATFLENLENLESPGRKKIGQGEPGGFLNFKLIPSNVREKAKESGRDFPAIT